MTPSDLSTLERALKRTEADLAQVLAQRDTIAIQVSPDSSDDTQFQQDRELAAQWLHLESSELSAVRLALRRIKEGSYGACQHCEGDIGGKRLAAIPWASHCVRCQEHIDRGEMSHDGPDFGSAASPARRRPPQLTSTRPAKAA